MLLSKGVSSWIFPQITFKDWFHFQQMLYCFFIAYLLIALSFEFICFGKLLVVEPGVETYMDYLHWTPCLHACLEQCANYFFFYSVTVFTSGNCLHGLCISFLANDNCFRLQAFPTLMAVNEVRLQWSVKDSLAWWGPVMKLFTPSLINCRISLISLLIWIMYSGTFDFFNRSYSYAFQFLWFSGNHWINNDHLVLFTANHLCIIIFWTIGPCRIVILPIHLPMWVNIYMHKFCTGDNSILFTSGLF